MPAFLSKVFSRGKDKEKEKDRLKEPSSPTKQSKRTSGNSLLEGKFEAISPTVSPSAQKFELNDSERDKEKEKDREKTALFRPKSRTKASNAGTDRKSEDVPHLTLNLNLPSLKDDVKEKRDLDVVYEGGEILDDVSLGQKRLSAADALKLMRACSSIISARGLETLGIMHPHWYSASPAVQRRIISLFLSSLTATPNASSTSPTSASSAFESELEYSRSPHDVAAVFRWALRHLKLDGDSFGNDSASTLGWYNGFSEQEKSKGYPKKAFSEILLPTVKPAHADLLNTTMDLISNLASHSEMNSVSGSKLSMFLGHHLLTSNKVNGSDDWLKFYEQWERSGRALEHIFLSSLRDEESRLGIPKRLAELIANYPYSKHAIEDRFPRPAQFATRAYDALYIRITSEIDRGSRASLDQRHPLKVIENALKSVAGEGGEDVEIKALWEEVKKLSVATEGEEGRALEQSESQTMLSRILSDESIRLLSLKPDEQEKGIPTITMFTATPGHEGILAKENGTVNGSAKVSKGKGKGKEKATNGSAGVSRKTSETTGGGGTPITPDWSFFSSAGFGESSAGQGLADTLLDNDLEKTHPPSLVPRRSLKKRSSPGQSANSNKPASISTPVGEPKIFKSSVVSLVKLDESFVDFWSDALLDPIINAWPTFVICQLKSSHTLTYGEKKIGWLVIEQKFVHPPLPQEEPKSPVQRASSPKPSTRSEMSESRPGVVGRLSSTFSATRKKFNFFGGESGGSNASSATIGGVEGKEGKKAARASRVGEMGEIIPEESPVSSPVEVPATQAKEKVGPVQGKSNVSAVAASGAGAAAAIATTAATVETVAPSVGPETAAAGNDSSPHVDEAKEHAVSTAETHDEIAIGVKQEPEKDEAAVAPEPNHGVSMTSVPENENGFATAPIEEMLTKPKPADIDNSPEVIVTSGVTVDKAELGPIADNSLPITLPTDDEHAEPAEDGTAPTEVLPVPVHAEVPEESTKTTEAVALDAPEFPVPSEKDETSNILHPGAGESRFVEQLVTPPDQKSAGLEPVPESDANVSKQEDTPAVLAGSTSGSTGTKDPVPQVPETDEAIEEEPATPAVAQPIVHPSPPDVEEPKEAEFENVAANNDVQLPLLEEPHMAPTEEPPATEELVASVANGSVVPIGEEPSAPPTDVAAGPSADSKDTTEPFPEEHKVQESDRPAGQLSHSAQLSLSHVGEEHATVEVTEAQETAAVVPPIKEGGVDASPNLTGNDTSEPKDTTETEVIAPENTKKAKSDEGTTSASYTNFVISPTDNRPNISLEDASPAT